MESFKSDPGPIDNTSLADVATGRATDGRWSLRRGTQLQEGRDYHLVSDAVWCQLKAWYGLARGVELHRQLVVRGDGGKIGSPPPSGLEQPEKYVELQPPRFEV